MARGLVASGGSARGGVPSVRRRASLSRDRDRARLLAGGGAAPGRGRPDIASPSLARARGAGPVTAISDLKRRVASAADSEGLVDVAYARIDSPIGDLLLAATPRGLVRVTFPNEDEDLTLERLATRISPRVVERPERLDRVRRELDEYFAGRRREFDL